MNLVQWKYERGTDLFLWWHNLVFRTILVFVVFACYLFLIFFSLDSITQILFSQCVAVSFNLLPIVFYLPFFAEEHQVSILIYDGLISINVLNYKYLAAMRYH